MCKQCLFETNYLGLKTSVVNRQGCHLSSSGGRKSLLVVIHSPRPIRVEAGVVNATKCRPMVAIRGDDQSS